MSGIEERRAVLVGEGVLHPNTQKQEFLARRAQQADRVTTVTTPIESGSKSGMSLIDQSRIEAKRERIAKHFQKYEQGGDPAPPGRVFVATGPTVPMNTYGGSKSIVDPAWGFKNGVTQFSKGHTDFTNTVFAPDDKNWRKTKYGSQEEHRQASVAVQSEIASGGHALFHVDPTGTGYLGKHDPMLNKAALLERIKSGTILGIPSGMKTSTSSKFTSFREFNKSEQTARKTASGLISGTAIGDFKGSAQFKVLDTKPRPVGISVDKSGAVTPVSKTLVTLNAPTMNKKTAESEINAGRASGIGWNVAQHFPTK